MADFQKSFNDASDYLSNTFKAGGREITDALGITKAAERPKPLTPDSKNPAAFTINYDLLKGSGGLTEKFAIKAPNIVGSPQSAADVQMENLKALSEPKGVLAKFEGMMTKFTQPAPAGLVVKALEDFGKTGSGIEQQALKPMSSKLAENLKLHIYNDGLLSPRETVQALAKTGNDLNPSKPEAGILQTARDTLQRLGISDPKGELSTGLAKAAVYTAVEVQPVYAKSVLINEMEKDASLMKQGEPTQSWLQKSPGHPFR